MTDEERLHMVTEQLILVRDNLFRGMSKSMQKLQARSINEALELENFTGSAQPAQQEPVAGVWTKDGWKKDAAQPAPDYAWPTIADYEKEVGFEVNIAFRSAWAMARTTNDIFK